MNNSDKIKRDAGRVKAWIKTHPEKVEFIGILLLVLSNIIFNSRIWSVTSLMLMWFGLLRCRLFMKRNGVNDDGRFLW